MEAMRCKWNWRHPFVFGRLDFGNFEKFNKKEDFWGVGCVTLHYRDRKDLIGIAKTQTKLHLPYAFSARYKRPGRSFRCDGFVEWCYEEIGLNNGQGFEDDKYKVYGKEVKVKIYANDIDDCSDGSGITRVQLWVGEPDDTPEEMPGFRIMGDDDDEDYPADHDYTYTWDTTLTIQKDGHDEPLFPNGDYILKTVAFDQAGNKAEAELAVEVANAEKYLYVHIEPSYVETDGSNNDRTGAFDVYVEVWDFGKCPEEGCSPEGCVPKKEGTQNWYYDGEEGKYKQEVCCKYFDAEPKQDTEISGTVVLSPLHPDINLLSESSGLWKNGWDGAIEITDGVGFMGEVRYRDKDGNSISGRRMVFLVEASMGNANGNDLLMINPIFLEPDALGGNTYEYQSRGIRGNFEPTPSVGNWGKEDCPPEDCYHRYCYVPRFSAECGDGNSCFWNYPGMGDRYKKTWCEMLKEWAIRTWSAWSNEPFPVQVTISHYIEYYYLLAHMNKWSGQDEYHKRVLAAQKQRIPYHAVNPDTGEILTSENIGCAVVLAKFHKYATFPSYNFHVLFSPTVTCQSSGVARVIHEEIDEEIKEYDFGDVSSLFNGDEYIKVEFHPDESILPTLFPYEGEYNLPYPRTILKFQSGPQIMVIPSS
jgi:hypothetical protein